MRQWVVRHGLPEGVPSELRLKEKKPVCRQPRWEPAEVWQEAEDTQKVSVQKCRQSLIKLAREVSIPQRLPKVGEPGELLTFTAKGGRGYQKMERAPRQLWPLVKRYSQTLVTRGNTYPE